MRFVSFHDSKATDVLMSTGSYVPDVSKCRERSSYDEDGGPKVWMFNWDAVPKEYSDIMDGKFFQRCRNEMSMDEDCFAKDMYMWELEVPDDLVSVGQHHNSCSWAFVTPTVSTENLVSVFKLEPTRHWFYINAKKCWVSPILTSRFPDYIDTFANEINRDELFTEDYHPDCKVGKTTECTCCEVETSYYRGKYPVCSSECVEYLNQWLTDTVPESVYQSIMNSFKCTHDEARQRVKRDPQTVRFFR